MSLPPCPPHDPWVDDERSAAGDYCECGVVHDIDELDFNVCKCCGHLIELSDYEGLQL